MVQMRRFGGFAVLALAALFAAPSDAQLVTSVDRRAAEMARQAKDEYCAGGFRGTVDRTEGRSNMLQAAGDQNVVLEVLQTASSSSTLVDAARAKINGNYLFGRAWPFAGAIIIIIIWLFCCWSAWPFRLCCRCCRCCVKERSTMGITKAAGVFILLGILIGIIVATALAARGFRNGRDGFLNFACTGGKLLDTTLSGQSQPRFVGLMPMLETFDALAGQLNDGSPLVNDVNRIVSDTSRIEKAVYVVTETLNLLGSTLALPANTNPGSDHECLACQTLADSVLLPASQAIQGGVGAALAAARSEIAKQMLPANRASIKKTITDSVSPLNEVKNLVRQTFDFMLDVNRFRQVQKQIDGDSSPVMAVTLAVMILAFILVAFTCCSCWTFVCCEKRKMGTSQESYRYCTHRVACCSWCCGFLYVLATFILGGVLMVVSVPLGSLCLVLDDISGNLVKSISRSVDLKFSDNGQETMVLDIVDKCFSRAYAGQNPDMMDILFIIDSNNTKRTARQMLVTNLLDSVNDVFDQLTTSMQLPSSSTDNSTLKLRSIIGSLQMDSLILPKNDPSYWSQSAQYQAMFQDQTLASNALGSGLACSDVTLPAEVGGRSVAGVQTFKTQLETYGTAVSGNCDSRVVCTGSDPARLATCNAGNNFMQLKQNLRSSALWRCDVFQDPANPANFCDPLNMTKSGNVWLNDCLNSQGLMVRKTRTCTLPNFVDYVKGFDARFQKVFQRLDDDANAVKDAIASNLKTTIQRNMLEPIDSVASGLTCGFLNSNYRESIDGLCYQGVWGMRTIGVSYVVCALLICALIILTYSLWRRSVDNVNSKQEELPGPGASSE